MADTYKILGQSLGYDTTVVGSVQAATIYTVPDGKQAAISSISVINSSSSNQESYELGVLKAADVNNAVEQTQKPVATAFASNPYVANSYQYTATSPESWTKSEISIIGGVSGIKDLGLTSYAQNSAGEVFRIFGISNIESGQTLQYYLAKTLNGSDWVYVGPLPDNVYPAFLHIYNDIIFLGNSSSPNSPYLSNDGGASWNQLPFSSNSYGQIFMTNRTSAIYIPYISSASSQYYRTEDGINWTAYDSPANGSSWTKASVANGRYFLLHAGSQTLFSSLDGISWTTSSISGYPSFASQVYYTSGIYAFTVQYNNSKKVAVSQDGINWSYYFLPPTFLNSFGLTGIVEGTDFLLFKTDPNVSGYPEVTGVTVGSATRIFLSGDNYTITGMVEISLPTPLSGLPKDWWSKIQYLNGKYYMLYSTSSGIEVAYKTLLTSSQYQESSEPWIQSYIDETITDKFLRDIYPSLDVSDYGAYSSVLSLIASYNDPKNTIPQKSIILQNGKNRELNSGQINEVSGGITLSSGDQVRILSTSSDVIAQVYGVELG